MSRSRTDQPSEAAVLMAEAFTMATRSAVARAVAAGVAAVGENPKHARVEPPPVRPEPALVVQPSPKRPKVVEPAPARPARPQAPTRPAVKVAPASKPAVKKQEPAVKPAAKKVAAAVKAPLSKAAPRRAAAKLVRK
jgi:hypothetical protein